MRKFIVFLLVFVLVFSSMTSFAAEGDIIHTDLKRIYRKGNPSDLDALLDDIINGADTSKFYEETSDGKYVNVEQKEKEQMKHLQSLILANNIKTPEELTEYMANADNKAAIDAKFDEIATLIAKTFNEIPDTNKGSIGDYLGSSEAPKLKTPTNYSIPVPGSEDNTTKIVKLTRPTGIGATKWLYKIVDTPTYLKLNDVLEGGNPYSPGNNIEVSVDEYLLLCAVDGGNKVKAYASIKITADMVKMPRVQATKNSDITATFEASGNYSGATKISGTFGEGAWKVSVLDSIPDKVYVDSEFNSKDYVSDMELVVASDVELDNNLEGFKKYIIIYSVKDGKIEKYNILEIPKDKVSGIKNAELLEDTIVLDKGNASGTTMITEPKSLPTGTTKWMSALVENNAVVPKLDRVYPGSKPYEIGQDIPLTVNNKYLMLLATDDNGKVKRYEIVEIKDGMIKNPPPMELFPGTHYKDIFKGDNIGQTKVTVNSSPMLDELFTTPGSITWRYVVSKTPIAVPEMNGKVDNAKVFSTSTSFDIATESELRGEDPFNRYLMVLATEGVGDDYQIKGYSMINIDRNHVKYPDAKLLTTPDNYSAPDKGSAPGTTKIVDVKNTGIDNHNAWWYKVVKGATPPAIEFKESITRINGFNSFSTLQNIAVEPNDYIVLVSVDRENKALGYANIKVNSTQITASTAIALRPIQNYEGPVPGNKASSTKLTKLLNGSLTNVNGWMYKVGKATFGTIETGADTTGYTPYTVGTDIEGVEPNDRLLLVAVDNSSKVIASTEITLTSTMIRGRDGIIMSIDNYSIEKGSTPSTTKLTNLNRSGIDGYPYTGWKWMYKVLDNELTGSSLPYINQKVDGTLNYTEGRDIIVNHTGEFGAEYGYILLLATDSAGLTKAYAQIPVTTANVREAAPKMSGVSLKPGDKIDRTKFDGLVESNKYLYKIDTKSFTRPAVGDTIIGGTPYIIDGNIGFSVKIGSHIILYEVDSENKVKAYFDHVVTKDDLAKGQVSLVEKTLLEGSIVNGGEIITFTLSGDDKWNDVRNDKAIRDKLFAGLKADNQLSEWSKVVNTLQSGGSGYIFVNGKEISIRLPSISDYNITDDQTIQLVIPPEAIEGAINPLIASGKITIKPTIRANVSGTVVSQVIRQKDIQAGGATIVISLTDASWGLDTSKILDNSYVEGVATQEDTNWHKIKAAINSNPSSIVVSSDKVITITLPKVSNLAFGIKKETITLKIPQGLIQGATEDVIANPSFTLYPDEIKVELKSVDGKELVIMQAPDNKVPLANFDTWEVELTNTTFKSVVTDKDISIIGLPAGLKPVITRKSDKVLEIKLTGTASSSVVDGVAKLRIKGTAVNELNSVDSDSIDLIWKKGTPMSLTEVGYNLESDGTYLTMPVGFDHIKIEYSVNSKNGSDGNWYTISSINHRVYELIGPLKIYVREIAQPKVFREVVNLIPASAPIVSVKDIKYYVDGDTQKVLQEVTLDSTETELEYNTGDDKWHPLVNGTVSKLDFNSVLKVRKIGNASKLPSLPTAKLNGLFLGDVKLNVGESKIDGATTQMQYSLNSDETGKGGSWNIIKAPNPVIDFASDNIVWIREGTSEVNKRKLGKVIQAEALPDNIKDSIEYDVLNKTITNKSDIVLEYRIANGNWFTLDKRINESTPNIVNNVVFAPGNIELRRKGSSNSLPSTSKVVAEIPLPINPPELKFDNDLKTIMYNDGGVFKNLDDNFEYKLGTGGDWKNGSNLSTDAGMKETVTVFVRKKPTEGAVASKEVSFNFTKNISFANVSVNVAGGYIDGTTTLMQYSTDSTNGIDGSWTLAKAGKTDVSFLEGMDLWIREKDKPSTATRRLTNLSRMAELITDSDLEYNVLNRTITNKSTVNLEYRLAEGPWIKLDAGATTTVDFIPGNFEFRTRATADKLESIIKLRATILAPLAKPNVTYSDLSNKVLSINTIDRDGDWKEYEYRLKNTTTWVNANLLKNLDLSGEKTVEIRKKATSTLLASQIAEISFTKNLNLDSVVLSKHSNPLELNGTAVGMEYKVFLKNATPPTTWSKCTSGDTKLTGVTNINDVSLIIIRDGRVNSSEGERILYPENFEGPVDLSLVKYHINDTNISFTGLTDKMEYKIGEDGEWTVGSDFSTSDLSPVKVYVRDINIPELYRVISIDAPPAPTGISIKDVIYDDTGAKVTLDGFNDKMEYSLDNGANWFSNTTILLNADSDLLVRYKSVSGGEGVGKLPSIPTAKINGLYLGKVGINATQNLLTNTSTLMEYSLDSTNGIDGKWIVASDVSTSVVFEHNMTVWIRQKDSKVNKREVGTIERFTFTQTSLNNVIYNIKAGTIANNTNSTLEYRFDSGYWITILKGVTHNGVEFKPGKFEVRKKGTTNSLASEPLVKAVISDRAMPPKVQPVANISDPSQNRIQFTTDGSTWNNIDNTFEYRVGNSEWIPGDTLPIVLGGYKVVYVRKVASSTTLSSKEAILYFNTTGNVIAGEVDVSAGKLTSTSVDMEYSLNSTDGLNGKWIVASAGSTSVVFEPGMNVWFREKGRPETFFLSIFNIERNSEPNLSNISYDILSKTIFNDSNQALEFRISGGDWIELKANDTAYEVEFKSGKLEFRKVATSDKLPSLPKEKDIIKAPASGPIVVIDDINNKVVSINSKGFGWSEYEYRIGTGGWITAELLATEDLVGNKTIDIRLKATSSDLASQVTQVKFTVNLPLESVRLSTHTTPFELNGTTADMEYMIYYNDGTLPTPWTRCTATNTKIAGLTDLTNISEIWIRDSRTGQQSNQFKVWSK